MVLNATLKQYFSYFVAVSFIGGGNWRTRRKPLEKQKISQQNK
jgi:hypothetical protein